MSRDINIKGGAQAPSPANVDLGNGREGSHSENCVAPALLPVLV